MPAGHRPHANCQDLIPDVHEARFLHKEFFEFQPQFVLWLSANNLPRVQDTSEGFWRRCVVTATAAELYAAFHAWSETQGVPDTRILSKNAFGRRLKLRFERCRVADVGRGKAYRGLALLPDAP
jgi:phage/plasmid-associated DNA primase